MMSIVPRTFAHRMIAIPSSPRVVVQLPALRATSSAKPNNSPSNPEGPMFAGYQEFLDDLTKKSEDMHASMAELNSNYGNNIGWIDRSTIDDLMNLSETHKREMKEQLDQVQNALEAAKTNYAVDAPDGECDAHLEEEYEEIKHILEEEADHKRTA